MKKILGLLAAVTLTATTSSLVVSCGTTYSRIDKPQISEDLAKEIIAKILGETAGDIDFGSLFDNGDITNTLINLIDTLVTQKYGLETTNSLLSQAGKTAFTGDKVDNYNDLYYTNVANSIAQNKLFTEYTKSINEKLELDYTLPKDLWRFNPIKDVTIDGTVIKAGTPIKFNGKTWKVTSESGPEDTDPSVLPTIKDLTQKDSPFTIGGKEISASQAISLRFQDYFINKIQKDSIKNMLTMSYDKNTLWRVDGADKDKGIYINQTSPFWTKVQKWKNSDMSSNVRMVWTITVNKDDKSKLADNIQANTGDGKLLSAGGSLNDAKTSLTDLFAKLTQGVDIETNTKDGYDPFLGILGYKGIGVYPNGTAVGTDPVSGAAYAADIQNYNSRGGILAGPNAQTNWDYSFANADDKNLSDYVFVLPVNMVELLGGVSSTSRDAEETSPIYKITDADNKQIDINLANDHNDKDRYIKWYNNNLNEKYHTKDIAELANNTEKREDLFQEIQYIVSQDANLENMAKKTIYSKYIDPEKVYYQGLWDQIGQYISDDEDEDE